LDQRDARGTVRVVFDGDDLGGDVALFALEIDDAVFLFVTAANVTRPLLLRPPLRFLTSTSDFSGFDFVISSKAGSAL
jgi:hypothetical protein